MKNPFKINTKKYYIVSYSFQNGNGCISMETENMAYLNREKAIELINKKGDKLGNIIITNIIKLSKKEYDCWVIKGDK